ncbi:sugar phosphate isomerase/epimerase family protein [Defluviitalea phaphyphila]|uniref:sugar phosphate isomerase/epimerase family protein n=1 Tax=Defluviitalea phaphyphila TaxID=1473580 RepID=UPI0007DC1A6F|nr:sugar phosphate isomerase/epimerase [Defluviitalea phaphyphila]
MKKLPIALQVHSIREEAKKDFKKSMKSVKDMGYDGVELAGLYGYTPEYIKEHTDSIGLEIISAHVPYEEIIEDMKGTIEKYAFLGCEYIAVPYLEEDLRPGHDNFKLVLENIGKMGSLCKERNITLLYHNHDFEFVKMESGIYALDYIYNEIPKERLETELDTCWVKVAGESPVEYIRKYSGRCPLIHLKDFVGSKSENMDKKFEFRPLGQGVQDIPSILKVSIESGAKWVVVEQDKHTQNKPMEDARISIEYLKKLGW